MLTQFDETVTSGAGTLQFSETSGASLAVSGDLDSSESSDGMLSNGRIGSSGNMISSSLAAARPSAGAGTEPGTGTNPTGPSGSITNPIVMTSTSVPPTQMQLTLTTYSARRVAHAPRYVSSLKINGRWFKLYIFPRSPTGYSVDSLGSNAPKLSAAWMGVGAALCRDSVGALRASSRRKAAPTFRRPSR